MKALTAMGGPTHTVGFTEVAEPTAGLAEAVVEVDAFSVNRGEVFALSGVYGTPAERGWLPGQDVAGRVVRAAADGSGPAVSQRVVGHPDAGGWAERVAVPVTRLAVLPDNISAIDAAALPLAGLTALRLLREAGAVSGRRILLTGASGGVGHFVTELATAAGAEVTVVTASTQRGQRLATLGARHVVQDICDALGTFDVVLESVGGETFTTALSRLAPGGTVLWFGQASLTPVMMSFFDLFGITPATIKHFPHWISTTSDGEDLETLVRLVATDRLHPEIGRTADWAETAMVLDDLARRRIRGNAVLTVTA
jgi:NADPH:quinone reductase-like Zn-dependent oxidoreductase